MNCIAMVDNKWSIGRDSELLFNIVEDMQWFKSITLGKVVVMGRKTFDSIPGGALIGRINIVLSKSESKKGCINCKNTNELFIELSRFKSNDIFVIGGEQIYHKLLPFCSKAYITRIDIDGVGNKYFPNLDKIESWKLCSYRNITNIDGFYLSFCEYYNNSVCSFL